MTATRSPIDADVAAQPARAASDPNGPTGRLATWLANTTLDDIPTSVRGPRWRHLGPSPGSEKAWLSEVTLMTESEQLLAIEEIKQVKARYFRCMDTKDWPGFEAVFAPNATVDYTPPGGNPADWSTSGRTNIVAFVRKTVELAITVHHGHMPEVEVTSPTAARAIFAMEDLIWWPEGSRRKSLHGWGHYHETYERIDGKWLIKSLRLTRLRVDQT
jgi:hypothetical protein